MAKPMTTLLTTLSRLITENTEITEIKVHENSSQRPDLRGSHSGTWSGNKLLNKKVLYLQRFWGLGRVF